MIPLAQKQQKTKCKIRPPRKSGVNNSVNPEESWKLLRTAIHDIQNKNASKWSFEQLYRIAYNLVLSKHGQFLYSHIHDEIVKHLEENTRVQLETLILEKCDNTRSNSLDQISISKLDAAKILNLFNKLWDDHLICIWLISQVGMYMDRTFTKENRLPLIYDVGLLAFQKSVIMYKLNALDVTIGMELIKIFLFYFNLNRNGDIIDKFLIKSTIAIFESLINTSSESYYNKYFEPELLVSSHRYYLKKISELLALQSGSLYINKVIEIIRDEESRFQIFLTDQAIKKLKDLMYKDLIVSNFENILNLENDGLKTWIQTDNYDLLSKVYNLMEYVDTNKIILKKCLRDIVISNGMELKELSKILEPEASTEMNDDKKKKNKKPGKENNTQFAINYIKNFTDSKLKYDKIIMQSFNNDIEFYREIESACTTFLNENNRIQEYLSLYIDDCIKKSLKNKTSEEIENVFNNSILVFKFIKDKDIFEKYYKNHLAKRLLNNKSLSTELELSMINKLKKEAGSTFTSKFEGMFKDIKISQDITSMFREEAENSTLISDLTRMNDGHKFDVDFSILTTNFWPMPVNRTLGDVNYVPALDITKASFEKFYHNTYNGRNLTWAPNMCTMDLKMHFLDKTYVVNMPTLAAFIILTCFNDDDTEDGTKSLSFVEIQELTKIPTIDLIRHLQSVSVAPKTRILKKVPMSRDIKPSDRFSLNLDFKNPQTKFKILAVSLSSSTSSSSKTGTSTDSFDATLSGSRVQTDEEHGLTLASIQESREYEVDAAIVRVMKARKSAKYQVLVAEVIRIISDISKRFRPQPSLVKRRIEELIDKEYLKRDETDRELFWYIA